MRSLFISLILLSFSNSAYLLTYDNKAYCVSDYFYPDWSNVVKATAIKDNHTYTFPISSVSSIKPYYDYNSTAEICSPKTSEMSEFLQIPYEDYNFLIALLASFVGFTILFFSVYTFVEVAKK